MSEHNAPVYVRLGADKGQVLLMFTKDPEGSQPANISQWRIDPKECLEICEAMATSAFEADTALTPVGDALKSTLVEILRLMLTQRFALMVGTMRGDRMVTDGRIAQALVDAALQEIF